MKKLNKTLIYKRIICAMLAALTVTVTTNAAVFAQSANSARTEAEVLSENTVKLSSNSSADNTASGEKDETVYVLSSSDGAVKKIIVSDWLKNSASKASINDISTLDGITNVKGKESMSASGSTVDWQADGSDIYYRGTTDSALPVEIKITYTLDGKTVSADELAGKSGKVCIRYDYINKQKKTVELDGENTELYVPFAVITALMLPTDTFRNVELSGGRLINDGDRAVAVGFSLPGMNENLGELGEDISLPQYFEITADVTDFELDDALTIATDSVFDDIDIEKTDKLDELKSSIAELAEASQKLCDGTSELYDGISELYSKSSELKDGVGKLTDGAKTLTEGADKLSTGASELASGAQSLSGYAKQLAGGAEQAAAGVGEIADNYSKISGGLASLDSNSAQLEGGALAVFNTLLGTAQTQLSAAGIETPALTATNYSAVLSGVLAKLDPSAIAKTAQDTAKAKIAEAVAAQSDTIRAAVTEAVKAKVTGGVLAASGQNITVEEYAALCEAGKISADVQKKMSAAVDAQMASDEIKAQIEALVKQKTDEIINEKLESDEVKAQLEAAEKAASDGAASIKTLIGQLDAYNEFYKGVQSYTGAVSALADGSAQLGDGIDQLNGAMSELSDGAASISGGAQELSGGAGTLSAGVAELAGGAHTLSDGISQLYSSTDVLIDGIKQLYSGSSELNDGMKKFDEEGVDKLTDTINSKLSSLTDRINALTDLAKEYNNYSGIAGDMSGEVKFIYKTDPISK